VQRALRYRQRRERGRGDGERATQRKVRRHAAVLSPATRARRWAVRMVDRVSRDNISVLSASVAFYTFVSIPSFLTAVVSLYGLAFDPQDVEQQVAVAAGVLPKDVIAVISDFLKMLASRPPQQLGSGLVVGILVAVWGGQSAASSLITALNAVHEKRETRGFVTVQATAFAIATCAIALALIAAALLEIITRILDLSAAAQSSKFLVDLVRWPILVGVVGCAVGAIYRFAPSPVPRCSWGFWGAGLATILWLASSSLFALYVSDFASYDVRYGSLGAMVVLLLWLYLVVFAVLLGAELNADIECDAR